MGLYNAGVIAGLNGCRDLSIQLSSSSNVPGANFNARAHQFGVASINYSLVKKLVLLIIRTIWIINSDNQTIGGNVILFSHILSRIFVTGAYQNFSIISFNVVKIQEHV